MLSLVIQAGYEGGDIAEFLLLQWSPMPTENKLQHLHCLKHFAFNIESLFLFFRICQPSYMIVVMVTVNAGMLTFSHSVWWSEALFWSRGMSHKGTRVLHICL